MREGAVVPGSRGPTPLAVVRFVREALEDDDAGRLAEQAEEPEDGALACG